MNAKILVLLFAFPSLSFADTTYVIRNGDTLLSIADRTIGIVDNKKDPRRFDFAKKIRAKNPNLKNPNSLNPGETLILPDYQASGTAAASRVKTNSTKARIETSETETIPTPITPPVVTIPPPQSQPQPQLPATPPAQPTVSTADSDQAPFAASPASAPAPAKHEGAHSDFIGVQPRYQMASLKFINAATEAEAKVKTKSSAGIDLRYGKAWGDHSHVVVGAGFTYTEFKPLEDGNTMNHMTESQKSFVLGFEYELLPLLELEVLATAADRTFLVPGTTSTIDIKSIMIPGAEVALSLDAIRADSFAVGVTVTGEYVGEIEKEGIKYKSSLEPLYALYWKSDRGHDDVNYRAAVTYKKGHQETNVSEQKEELWIAGLMMTFPL